MENPKLDALKSFIFYTMLLLILFLVCGKDSNKKESYYDPTGDIILEEQRQLQSQALLLQDEIERLHLEVKRKERGY